MAGDRPALRATLLLGVIGGGFVLAPEPVWAMSFYLLVLPGQLWRLRQAGWRQLPPAGDAVAMALILWLGLATFWDRSASGHLLWLFNGGCTLAFLLACREARPRDLASVVIAGGAVNAAIAIVRHLAQGAMEARMPGWAETRHPILGAAIIGVMALLAAARLLEGRRSGEAWAYGAAVGLGLGFIGLTGSRGPMLATALALLVLVGLSRPWRLVWLVVGVAAILPLLPAGWWQTMAARGGSHRPEIWQQTLDVLAQAPWWARWVGLGPNATIGRPGEDFPHNLFLSTAFYGGLVGLALLLALLALALRAAWRGPDRALKLALLVQVVGVGMTDLSNLAKGPSPMWYMVWLPLILCLSPRPGLLGGRPAAG